MSEITPSLVYWITRLDYVRICFGVLIALCVIAIIGLAVYAISTKVCQCNEIDEIKKDIKKLDSAWGSPPFEKISEYIKREVANINDFNEEEKNAWRILRNVVVLLLLLIVGMVFVPTTKEMCTIIVIPKIANSEIVQKDLPKAVESVVKIAQDYLEDLADINKKGDEK